MVGWRIIIFFNNTVGDNASIFTQKTVLYHVFPLSEQEVCIVYRSPKTDDQHHLLRLQAHIFNYFLI